MKRIVTSLFVLICVLTVNNAFAQSQKKNEKLIKMVRRTDQIGYNGKHSEDYLRWHRSLSAVFPIYSVNEDFNDMMLVILISRLWKDDVFQKEVSDKLLPRISLIPKPSYDEWCAALEKYSGEQLTNQQGARMYALCLLIQQDRLFDGERFNGDGSKVLLKRLESVTRKAITKWFETADTLQVGGPSEAAFLIIEQDIFFQNDVFQEEQFNKKLNEMVAAKSKK